MHSLHGGGKGEKKLHKKRRGVQKIWRPKEVKCHNEVTEEEATPVRCSLQLPPHRLQHCQRVMAGVFSLISWPCQTLENW